VATRVEIRSQRIDLPIISRNQRVRDQGPDLYPPCDVALYHTAFGQPGQGGVTYLYAHAREGMFLPLLTASEKRDGASLLGDLVQVTTSDGRLHVYAIVQVKRHALDFSIIDAGSPGVEQLILQTSEGPAGTVPKLQVRAELLDVQPADPGGPTPTPKPKPRACYGE
jgi:hypothetical protein